MTLGPLLGEGRTARVYVLDDHHVVRRLGLGIDPAGEVAAMGHVTRHGYPAPRVSAVEGHDMVLERLHGPTLLAALQDGTCDPVDGGRILADLLARLHCIPGRPGAPAGTCVVHLDLHPGNVILTPAGPMAIDWTNARDGVPAEDVAMSALIVAQAACEDGVSADLRALALGVLAGLLSHSADPRPGLEAAAAHRAANPTMSVRERAAIPPAVALITNEVTLQIGPGTVAPGVIVGSAGTAALSGDGGQEAAARP